MTYLATSINNSPVISEKAGATIADVRGKAVKFADGKVVLADAATDVVIGVGIMTNDENIAAGADVDVQVKEMGLVLAGAEITKGAELAANAEGALVPAAEGNFVCAIALEDAAAAGVYIKALLVKYTKEAAQMDETEEE